MLTLYVTFGLAHAHEDPRGDVHPQVQVEDGKFVVYFKNNTEPKVEVSTNSPDERTREEPIYKTVVSPDGKILAKRVPVESEPSRFPEWMKRLLHGDPFGVAIDREKEPLLPAAWPDGKRPHDLEGITIQNNRLFFYFTGGKDESFRIGAYDLDKKKLLQSAIIGIPGRIYSFARASAVIARGNEAWIAWIEERNVKVEEGFYYSDTQLVVSRWDLTENKVAHLPIRQTEGRNIYLSLNRLEDHLLVAWHERAFPHAQVWTEHIDLKSAKFSAELPLSSLPSHGLKSHPSP